VGSRHRREWAREGVAAGGGGRGREWAREEVAVPAVVQHGRRVLGALADHHVPGEVHLPHAVPEDIHLPTSFTMAYSVVS